MLLRGYKHNINILLTYSYYNIVFGIFEAVDLPCDVWTMYLTFVAAGVHFLVPISAAFTRCGHYLGCNLCLRYSGGGVRVSDHWPNHLMRCVMLFVVIVPLSMRDFL